MFGFFKRERVHEHDLQPHPVEAKKKSRTPPTLEEPIAYHEPESHQPEPAPKFPEPPAEELRRLVESRVASFSPLTMLPEMKAAEIPTYHA